MRIFLIVLLSLWVATNAIACLHLTATMVRWIKETPIGIRARTVAPGTNITAAAVTLLVLSISLLYRQVNP